MLQYYVCSPQQIIIYPKIKIMSDKHIWRNRNFSVPKSTSLDLFTDTDEPKISEMQTLQLLDTITLEPNKCFLKFLPR